MLTGFDGRLTARERGVVPGRVALSLAEDVELSSGPVGLAIGWTVSDGLRTAIELPDLALKIQGETIPVGEGDWDAIQDADRSARWSAPGHGGLRRRLARLADHQHR